VSASRVDLNENVHFMASPSVRHSLLLAAALVLAPPLAAQAPAAAPQEGTPTAKPWYEMVQVGGLLFGDAFAVVTHHDPAIDDQYGFWLRRGYLTFDIALATAWSARFRMEGHSPLVVELYADAEYRPDSTDRTTFHGFVGYRGAGSRFAVEYATQKREAAEGPDQTVAVASVFGVWDLGENLSLLARVDRSFDGIPDAGSIPDLGLAEETEFDLALVGLDYRLHKMVSLIPDVEYVAYRETDGRPAPDDDLIARLTLSVWF